MIAGNVRMCIEIMLPITSYKSDSINTYRNRLQKVQGDTQRSKTITLPLSKCALVCVHTRWGMLSFWSGICIGVHASLQEGGSFVALCCMSFLFLLRAASSVPIGSWRLYFSSWGIFCVACCCWRRLLYIPLEAAPTVRRAGSGLRAGGAVCSRRHTGSGL